MTMQECCDSCAKHTVCRYSDTIIDFVRRINEEFSAEFKETCINDILSGEWRCKEYLYTKTTRGCIK